MCPSLAASVCFTLWIGSLNGSDIGWQSELHWAAREGNVQQARLILTFIPSAANVSQNYGKGFPMSPVHLAAQYHRTEVLKVLLAHGGRVDDPGDSSMSPLQWAAWSGNTESANLLLKHGATLDIYSAAALNKRSELEKLLRLARNLGLDSFVANMQSDGPTYQTNPLLNWAVMGGHPEMIELLVRHGAEINPFRGPSLWPNYSPLHLAANRNCTSVVKTLLKQGADLESKNFDGFTPLHVAAERGSTDVARILLKHGARTDNREDHHAARVSDINSRLSMDTPLHTAARSIHPEMVELLLIHGAAPNAVNAYGETPLDIAGSKYSLQNHGRLNLLLLLRYRGVKGPGEKGKDMLKAAKP